MSEMKSGVYFVKYKDIKTFFLEVEKNGWKHVFTNPQAQAYNSLREDGKDDKTTKESVIPFSLDREKKRVGYWIYKACIESEVEEKMENWSSWGWTAEYIEFYHGKKVIL